jgi:hypothetical protein
MNRWAVRMAGALVLLALALVLLSLHRQLVALQKARRPAATSTR